jgi:hypothetical protein
MAGAPRCVLLQQHFSWRSLLATAGPYAYTLQVMKLRRRYDELSTEVAGLVQQRELLLTQISDDKAEWEKLQRVRHGAGNQPAVLCSTASPFSTSSRMLAAADSARVQSSMLLVRWSLDLFSLPAKLTPCSAALPCLSDGV